MYDKNLIINYIKQNAYKKYIDKKIIQKEFNCSEKTSERILRSINYNHMKQSSIDMMKDMVYTLVKAKESLPLGKPIGANDPL